MLIKQLLIINTIWMKNGKEFELTVEIKHEYYDLKISKIKQ